MWTFLSCCRCVVVKAETAKKLALQCHGLFRLANFFPEFTLLSGARSSTSRTVLSDYTQLILGFRRLSWPPASSSPPPVLTVVTLHFLVIDDAAGTTTTTDAKKSGSGTFFSGNFLLRDLNMAGHQINPWRKNRLGPVRYQGCSSL